MSTSDERMSEITVQGNPDLQEILLLVMQKLQSLEDKVGSVYDSTVATTGELQSLKHEVASIKAGGAEVASVKAGGAEIRSCYCAPMAATLWSTLPEELLQHIFARLPPPDIVRLQCLSKKWKMKLTSRDSGFTRACAEANPKMFAMVSEGYKEGCVAVQLYDIKANIWYWYEHAFLSCAEHTLYAGDGGLVCVVCTEPRIEAPFFITVFNPLFPQRSRVLPHEALRDLELQMLQLVMDRDRSSYKVLAVGEENGRVVAKIFSSETGAWDGEISQGLVFGHEYSWEVVISFPDDLVGPSAYDSVGRQLLQLDDSSHPCVSRSYVRFSDGDNSKLCYALVKDHLFVLHEEIFYELTDWAGKPFENPVENTRYCISEYWGRNCKPNWVKLRTHMCKGFACPSSSGAYKMSLYGCKGFLLVKAENDEVEPYRHVLIWLYEIATEKWRVLPPFAKKQYQLGCPSTWDTMFELQWDAMP